MYLRSGKTERNLLGPDMAVMIKAGRRNREVGMRQRVPGA